MEYPERKPNRLREFEYGTGAYFVTVCTQNRKCLLSEIISRKMTGANVGEGLAPPVEVRLTPYGTIAQEQLLDLENRYPSVRIHQYVIMPNHIHAIIQIQANCDEAGGASRGGVSPPACTASRNDGTGNPSPTLGNVIGWFKYHATKQINAIQQTPGVRIFQRSYYDHVIRNESDHLEIARYIHENPMKWTQDEFYVP